MKKILLVVILFGVLAGIIYLSTFGNGDVIEDDDNITNPTYQRLSKRIDVIKDSNLDETLYLAVLDEIEDAYQARPKNPLIDIGLKNRLIKNTDLAFIHKLNSTTQQTFVAGACNDKQYGIKVVEPLYKTMSDKDANYQEDFEEMMGNIKSYNSKRSLPYSFVPNLEASAFELISKWSKKKKVIEVNSLLNSARTIEGKGYSVVNACLKSRNTNGMIRQNLDKAHTAFVTHKIENYTGDDDNKQLIRTLIQDYQSVTYSRNNTVRELRELMQNKIDHLNTTQIDTLSINH